MNKSSTRLREQSSQLRKNRRVSVGLKVHLPAANVAPHQPGGRKLLKLTLDGANPRSCVPSEFAQIKLLVRMLE